MSSLGDLIALLVVLGLIVSSGFLCFHIVRYFRRRDLLDEKLIGIWFSALVALLLVVIWSLQQIRH